MHDKKIIVQRTPFGLRMLIWKVLYYCQVLLNFKKGCILDRYGPLTLRNTGLGIVVLNGGLAGRRMLKIRNKSLKSTSVFCLLEELLKVIRTDSSMSDLGYLCMNNQCYKYS